MLAALQSLGSEFIFHVEVVDIDTDKELVALYDELVPVLFGSKDQERKDAVQLCHYFLDIEKVRAFMLEN
jgi:hypothetical protein